jgi:hypothetical protein
MSDLHDVINTGKLLLDRQTNPVIRHKILKDILKTEKNDQELKVLKAAVIDSPLVKELEDEQLYDGSWGRFHWKDYSVRNKFPTTCIAIDRALYLGLEKQDMILDNALAHVEEVIQGKVRLPDPYEVNERWPALHKNRIAYCLEKLDPYNQYVDSVWHTWLYIVSRVFQDGNYSYEMDKKAQYEVFGITGSRLVPIPFELLLLRNDSIPPMLEQAMLDYCWERHCTQGYLWPEAKLNQLPETFKCNKTRRWLNTMEFFVRFRECEKYVQPVVEWVWNSKIREGFWDFGPQMKDPWGYFRYLSEDGWKKAENRLYDCSMEMLLILRTFCDSKMKM